MFFEIDTQNGVPVYQQVYRQITFAIAGGGISAGELVPSVRNLARELAINPSTVARAYRDLQADGIVEMVRGSGLIVTSTARNKCKAMRIKGLKSQFVSLLEEARRSQLSNVEIKKLFEDLLNKL